jgi:hypothetical protein
MVLSRLPKLVPNPPALSPNPFLVDGHQDHVFKSVWKSWIVGHAEEIKKLPSSAAGISFDPTFCSKLDTRGDPQQPH